MEKERKRRRVETLQTHTLRCDLTLRSKGFRRFNIKLHKELAGGDEDLKGVDFGRMLKS